MQEWDAFSGQSGLAVCFASTICRTMEAGPRHMTGRSLSFSSDCKRLAFGLVTQFIQWHCPSVGGKRHRWDMESGRKGDSGICWRVARKCVAVIGSTWCTVRGGKLAQIYEYDAVIPIDGGTATS